MKSYQCSSVKEAASHLFIKDTFDCFYTAAVSIRSYIDFEMDGHINKDFFDQAAPEAQQEYVSWKYLRQTCMNIIKGKTAPLSFRILFFLPAIDAAGIFNEPSLSSIPEIKGYTLNAVYHNKEMEFVTGTVFTAFSFDKSCERIFDSCISQWLSKQLDAVR